ncbi:MAG: hypothetical protein ACD_7C00141G0001 [uncultured bacterium]|nr:MAG: hypothetical protein ACD_7C00141G0001 [uncultured bacterium]
MVENPTVEEQEKVHEALLLAKEVEDKMDDGTSVEVVLVHGKEIYLAYCI